MGFNAKTEHFPCPLCSGALGVRQSKKHKPYVVCDPCGVQMFIRNQPGIRRFEELVAKAENGNAWERLAEMERRYHRRCPKCRRPFWVTPELLETSWFDGKPTGFKCPEEDCGGVVKLEARK